MDHKDTIKIEYWKDKELVSEASIIVAPAIAEDIFLEVASSVRPNVPDCIALVSWEYPTVVVRYMPYNEQPVDENDLHNVITFMHVDNGEQLDPAMRKDFLRDMHDSVEEVARYVDNYSAELSERECWRAVGDGLARNVTALARKYGISLRKPDSAMIIDAQDRLADLYYFHEERNFFAVLMDEVDALLSGGMYTIPYTSQYIVTWLYACALSCVPLVRKYSVVM